MKSPKTYLDLCTQVYELSKPYPPDDAYNFYKSYLNNARGAILEPMCGTGRFLLPFLREGFKIDGFDSSQHMLNALHEKAKSQNLMPNIWQGFIQEMTYKKKYNLIFIPSGSFGLLTDKAAVTKALKIFHTILDSNGTLVFEAETLKAIPSQFGTPHCSAYKCQDSNAIITTFFNLPPKNNISSTICRYELVENNHITKTEIEEFNVKFYDPESLALMLKDIGFSEVTLHKAFNRKIPPDKDDEVVVYECKK